MVILGNHSTAWMHAAAATYPNRLGWLQGPRHWKAPRPGLSYACDNDAFASGAAWSAPAWRVMLARVRQSAHRPRWILVPDVVCDRQATLRRWARFAPEAAAVDVPLAFAVQDGMKAADVPSAAAVVFVGGSTAWKWGTLRVWCREFARVHVGRVNTVDRLWRCQDAGAESVDGTGWVRNPSRPDQLPALIEWLDGDRPRQRVFSFAASVSGAAEA